MIRTIVLILLLSVSAYSAFPTGWGRKCEIVIQDSLIDANLTNFPVLLTFATLPAEMFVGGGANATKNGGGDIRFSSDENGSTRLPVDSVRVDTVNNTAEIWTQVPSITASGNTSIWIWYDSSSSNQPAADAAYGREAVYDANYITAHHLSEDPTGGAPQMKDATDTDGDGTVAGNPQTVSGQIDSALSFDGTGDEVDFGTKADYKLITDATWSTWIKLSSSTTTDDLPMRIEAGTGESEAENSVFFVIIRGVSNSWDIGYIHEYGSGSNESHDFLTNMNNDTWYYLSINRDVSDNEVIVFLNGAEVDTFDYTNDPTSASATLNYKVGRRGPASIEMTGMLDEIRLSDSERTPAWVKAEYKNQNAPELFAVEGTPEDVDGAPTELTRRRKVELRRR